jgi:uncharacterized protein HemY
MQKLKLSDDDSRLAETLHNLGQAFFFSKEYGQAVHCFEESIAKKEKM